jgi:hypothetical protein
MPLLLQGAACARALPARRSRARHAPRAAAAPPPAPPPAPSAAPLSRRAALAAPPALLLAAAAAAAALQPPPPARAADADTPPSASASAAAAAPLLVLVRPGPDDPAANTYGTIAAALEAAPAGAVVRVSGAYYGERLLVTRPVTLEAAPGDEGKVVVEHETELPYESTLQARAQRAARGARWQAGLHAAKR